MTSQNASLKKSLNLASIKYRICSFKLLLDCKTFLLIGNIILQVCFNCNKNGDEFFPLSLFDKKFSFTFIITFKKLFKTFIYDHFVHVIFSELILMLLIQRK